MLRLAAEARGEARIRLRVNSSTETTGHYSFLVELMRKSVAFVSVLTALQCVLYESAEGVLIEKPKDATVIVNQSTIFNCSMSDNKQNEPIWYHHPLVGARQDVYYNARIRDKYKDRFSIDKILTSRTFNLLVLRPETADAGKYECVEDVETDTGSSAELTVLDSNLICESDMDPHELVGPTQCDKPIARDQLLLSCSVTYSGNFPPQMQWKKVGSELQLNETKCDFRGNRVMCNATVEVNHNMNGSVYICQITTAPQYSCSLKVSKILYAFSGTSVKAITTAEEASCFANTSQGMPCSYTWYKEDKKTEQFGQTLKPNNHGIYRCEAACKIRKETCSFTAMIVYASEAETNIAGLNAGIIILFFVVAATILIVLVLSRPNRRNGCNGWKGVNKPNEENANEVPLVEKTSGEIGRGQSAEFRSLLPNITDEGMFDKVTINQYFIDKGASGAIYGPFRWKDKKCALKQMLFSPDKLTKETEEEIIQLRKCCMKLDHPHLVKVLEVWFSSPALCTLMEYAEGRSLDKILRPKDASSPLLPFTNETVQDWALQIADGMRYLHGHDLVHRNLKSAQVMVMELPGADKKTLKIGSPYQLATEHDNSTVLSIKGTMAWMAPECLLNEKFSKFSDVWSYGVTLWEMLTRDVPYKEMRKETDLVKAAMKETLKLEIPKSCPKLLQDLLTECWNYEVEKRPSFTRICNRLRLFLLTKSVLIKVET